jgi:hypothetical protein
MQLGGIPSMAAISPTISLKESLRRTSEVIVISFPVLSWITFICVPDISYFSLKLLLRDPKALEILPLWILDLKEPLSEKRLPLFSATEGPPPKEKHSPSSNGSS